MSDIGEVIQNYRGCAERIKALEKQLDESSESFSGVGRFLSGNPMGPPKSIEISGRVTHFYTAREGFRIDSVDLDIESVLELLANLEAARREHQSLWGRIEQAGLAEIVKKDISSPSSKPSNPFFA